ncbi:hypothetical protein V6N13_125851 [Hibiscus sabdariffa]|uniref:CLAVATA3/ESR (CLE)-related protein 9 n=1 Tax=Hibiscus sabdariffa TaxID=183260 RepID=A0ABR2U7N1_9ROSI
MSCYRLLLLLLLLFFILVFLLLLPLEASTPPPRSRHSCDSFPRSEQRSLCFQLQRLHNFQPFSPSSPPPPSNGEEIDPRYGVEKRLVPSGPNPLHN